MVEIRTTYVWATPLAEATNPDHAKIKDALISHCYESERRSKAPIESGVTPIKKSGLYESTFDFFRRDVPEIQSLRQFCAEAVSQAVFQLHRRANNGKTLFTRLSVDLHESWVHITRDGGYHEVHYHPNCSWCGIYYLQLGDCTLDPPNGINRFFAPVDIGYEDLGATAYPQTPVSYPPAEGKLVMFPSYVRHLAVPYRGKQDRIVISFNSRVVAPAAAP
jgi:uncharacterized protein (TIGR02466 family)